MILFKLFLLIIIICIIKYITTFEHTKYDFTQTTVTDTMAARIDLGFFVAKVIGDNFKLKLPDGKLQEFEKTAPYEYTSQNASLFPLGKDVFPLGIQKIIFYDTDVLGYGSSDYINVAWRETGGDQNILHIKIKNYNLKFKIADLSPPANVTLIPGKFNICNDINYMNEDASKSFTLLCNDVTDQTDILVSNDLETFALLRIPQ